MAKTMQQKFNAAMTAGKTLTVAQVQKLGFANYRDPAYRARQSGLNVQRSLVESRKGAYSVYALEV